MSDGLFCVVNVQPRVDVTRSMEFDNQAAPRVQHGAGLAVADDFLLVGIPLDFAPQPDRDIAQMADADGAVLAFDVGDHRQVVLETFEEISHVVAESGQVAFEQPLHVAQDFFFQRRIGILLFDGLAGDPATVHENPSLVSLEGHPFVFGDDVQLDSARVLVVDDRNLGRGVTTGDVGEHGLAAIDRYRARVLRVQGPLHDIDVVRTPVSHDATGIVVPPAELVMTALRDIIVSGRLALPEVPVQSVRNGLSREWPASHRDRQMDDDFVDLAQLSAADGGDRPAEQLPFIAALLRADLERLAGPLDRGDQLLPLVDRESQWFFAIDVLARIERRQGDGGVPMVGGADGHRFDIVAIEQLAIVLVDFGLVEMLVFGPLGMISIDVADRHDIGPVGMGQVGDLGASPADADAAEDRSIVLRFVGPCPLGKPKGEIRGGSQAGGRLHESTPIEWHAIHDPTAPSLGESLDAPAARLPMTNRPMKTHAPVGS